MKICRMRIILLIIGLIIFINPAEAYEKGCLGKLVRKGYLIKVQYHTEKGKYTILTFKDEAVYYKDRRTFLIEGLAPVPGSEFVEIYTNGCALIPTHIVVKGSDIN